MTSDGHWLEVQYGTICSYICYLCIMFIIMFYIIIFTTHLQILLKDREQILFLTWGVPVLNLHTSDNSLIDLDLD